MVFSAFRCRALRCEIEILTYGTVLMTWQVWRQDDNGNRFLVDEFASRDLAERRIAGLTQGHHKQTYWICEAADSRKTPPPGTI